MSTIPLVMTAAGPVATDPTTLRQNLIDSVAAEVPDYTANLPGSLIEDVASTDVGALTTIDQARVEAVIRPIHCGVEGFALDLAARELLDLGTVLRSEIASANEVVDGAARQS
ncbi:hypothetical protein L0Z12_05700 [Burkholderia multivorans]|nr:hypothetical protein [Burkholderia multivorans]MCO1402952.1 hypothetical protein [Burkholderia multivorans]UQO78526.1 hypothetical protein L0Z12_05700 [Burkholderia multivorans]